MALSMDDQLLGEKVHYYCSSEEESGDENDDDDKNTEESRGEETVQHLRPSFDKYPGYCTNTGPKGVLNDWREYKRLENSRREENEAEKLALAKKLSITCRSYLDDEEDSKLDEEACQEDEDFLQEYRRRRLEEMKQTVMSTPTYGHVIHLDTQNYVDAVDKELPNVTVIVHVYNEKVKACKVMAGCFKCLSRDYTQVKFCEISAIDANLSAKFAFDGVPAILVYRNKQLIGNYIRLSQELGDDFYVTDVESFLHEHGMLPFNDQHHTAIRDSCAQPQKDNSDFEVD